MILETKFHAPTPRPNLLQRPHLFELLDKGQVRKCTLVSAPAGYGKSTLISSWLHQREASFAWLSLEEADNDSQRFWRCVIAALQGIDEKIGQEAENWLRSTRPPGVDEIVSSLLNDLIVRAPETNPQAHRCLIFDDYHVITTDEVHQGMTFLVENAPPYWQIVILTRTDPPLRFPRWRVQGWVNDIRQTELQLDRNEVQEFFEQTTKQDLSAEELDTLATNTEGWMASLKLAAISLENQTDRAAFLESFAGDDRLVMDYLMDEVFSGQTEETQSFWLKTSLLPRLSAEACAAVLGDEASVTDCQSMLERLERENLFMIPLDNRRGWYRYHHLFADLLRRRLVRTFPDKVQALQMRAGFWFQNQELVQEAVALFFTAKKPEVVAEVIASHGQSLIWNRGELSVVRRWIDRLPEEIARSRPELSIYKAWGLYAEGKFEEIPLLIDHAERGLRDLQQEDSNKPLESTVSLRAQILALKTTLLGHLGTPKQARELLREAEGTLAELPATLARLRVELTFGLGESLYFTSDLERAEAAYNELISLSLEFKTRFMTIAALCRLFDVYRLQGRLKAAEKSLERGLGFAHEWSMESGLAHHFCLLLRALARLEKNQLEKAAIDLERLRTETSGRSPYVEIEVSLLLAHVLFLKGDSQSAFELNDSCESLANRGIKLAWYFPSPLGQRAQFFLMQKDIRDAQRCIKRIKPNDTPHVDAANLLIEARVHLAAGNQKDGLGLANDVLKHAVSEGRRLHEMEASVVLAVGQESEDSELALKSLARALSLAERGGFVRVFLEEGAPMVRLLGKAIEAGIYADYAKMVLQEFSDPVAGSLNRHRLAQKQADLPEALTVREIEVLDLISQGLTNQEVAQRLFLSPGTIKVHTRNIYAKLGVRSRSQAAAKGRDLGLLNP